MKKLALFFNMTEQERRGFLLIVLLITLLLLFPLAYNLWLSDKPGDLPTLAWVDQLDQLAKEDEDENRDSSGRKKFKDYAAGRMAETRDLKGDLFFFDPNNLPVEKWQALGFSDKQIGVIKNYEAKGGRFYDADDVAKIYSISAQEFERIAPFLQFSERSPPTVPRIDEGRKEQAAPPVSLNVNLADSIALQALRGIGPVLAARIVKFRDRLGGFYSVEQLAEIYGLPEETFAQIKPQLTLGDAPLKQLAINRITDEELAAHPYVKRKVAQIIIRYRDQHGNFDTITDLSKISILNAEFLRKIEPYLNFN